MSDQACGTISCISRPSGPDDASRISCSLPVRRSDEAAIFLETLGGAALGTGAKLSRLGVEMPLIREAYKTEFAIIEEELKARQRAGQSPRVIAEWIVKQRRQLATRIRMRSGVGTVALFEVRDWTKYGVGGRTYSNLSQRALNRGVAPANVDPELIKGALKTNDGISEVAIKGARYLKHGGRVVVVVGVASSVSEILNAPEGELVRVLSREGGGMLGGAAGSGLAVGACLVFGVATGGWGLLACGLVGGAVGGWVGGDAGEKAYFAVRPRIEEHMGHEMILPRSSLSSTLPEHMCVAAPTNTMPGSPGLTAGGVPALRLP